MAAQYKGVRDSSPGPRDQERAALEEFTLLMAVYADDDETYVRTAYLSATTDQTLPPTAVVIVRDGPVTAGVARWLDEISADPGVTVVALETNQGLARALNEGLAHIHTDLVARADADDICLPTRFARQIPLISSGLDVVGSAISEFSKDPRRPGPVRTVATTQRGIERVARLQSPFHHPSVVFRKQAVLRVGGYPVLAHMEDYLLWAKMLMNGARVANLPDVLVRYRIGAGAFHRRGGKTLADAEARLQKEFLAMGFTTRTQYLRNRVIRGLFYRRLPVGLRRFLYHAWQRAKAPLRSLGGRHG